MYIKSCPVCGGEAALSESVEDRTGYYCECYACGKSTDEFATRGEAAEAWNRSEAKDLKDTELRGMYAFVMKPFKTWRKVFIRFFFLVFGPVFAYTMISSLSPGSPGILTVGMALFAAVWLAAALFLFAGFSKKHFGAVRRLLKKERVKNNIAAVLAFFAALAAHTALFVYVVIPFAERCRYG
ncbi:MAG TPA: Lar family restriction alleviation protein [Oscillospiraceae bacterium]|nr:Lar family restriction alleviation protein [Oscillospiraceae bacterium]HPS36035.1 Lar family restriction alleviation protein [Oscillospiraceae bacterium]